MQLPQKSSICSFDHSHLNGFVYQIQMAVLSIHEGQTESQLPPGVLKQHFTDNG